MKNTIMTIIIITFFSLNCKSLSLMENKAQLAEKLDISKNKTDESKTELNIGSKTENRITAEKVENKNNKKTDLTLGKKEVIKANEVKKQKENNIALVNNNKKTETTQKAKNIENKKGLDGKDILYIFGGLSLFIGLIMLLIGKYFLKSKEEVRHEKNTMKKQVLKGSVLLVRSRTKSEEDKKVCDEILKTYDALKISIGEK